MIIRRYSLVLLMTVLLILIFISSTSSKTTTGTTSSTSRLCITAEAEAEGCTGSLLATMSMKFPRLEACSSHIPCRRREKCSIQNQKDTVAFTVLGAITKQDTYDICLRGLLSGKHKRTNYLSFVDNQKERKARFAMFNSINNDQEVSSSHDVPFERSKIRVSKPLGIVIEEFDEKNPAQGVMVASMDPSGNVIQSQQSCYVNDHIVSIDGEDCAKDTFEEVMEHIINSKNDEEIEITLERPLANSHTNYTVVEFPNHVAITAQSGDILGALAQQVGYGKSITYSCRNGGCGTCEHVVDIYKESSTENKNNNNNDNSVLSSSAPKKPSRRYMRPCVSRIPKSAAYIRMYSPYEE